MIFLKITQLRSVCHFNELCCHENGTLRVVGWLLFSVAAAAMNEKIKRKNNNHGNASVYAFYVYVSVSYFLLSPKMLRKKNTQKKENSVKCSSCAEDALKSVHW